jgi:hypothetical protein
MHKRSTKAAYGGQGNKTYMAFISFGFSVISVQHPIPRVEMGVVMPLLKGRGHIPMGRNRETADHPGPCGHFKAQKGHPGAPGNPVDFARFYLTLEKVFQNQFFYQEPSQFVQ